jgi:trk system potassium uptake protein TrkA
LQVVIAGCGRVGSGLAVALADDGHDVTVIDLHRDSLDRLGKSFNGHRLVGQAFDVETLTRARIEQADVFVAVTDSDNANLMAVEVAKEVFNVPRSIARLYDPAREASYRALNISFITGTTLISQVMYDQIVEDEFTYHVTFTEGDVDIVEFHLGSAADGVELADFEIRDRLRVAAVHRGDQVHIPAARFVLREGDLIVAAARGGVSSRIQKFISEPHE